MRAPPTGLLGAAQDRLDQEDLGRAVETLVQPSVTEPVQRGRVRSVPVRSRPRRGVVDGELRRHPAEAPAVGGDRVGVDPVGVLPRALVDGDLAHRRAGGLGADDLRQHPEEVDVGGGEAGVARGDQVGQARGPAWRPPGWTRHRSGCRSRAARRRCRRPSSVGSTSTRSRPAPPETRSEFSVVARDADREELGPRRVAQQRRLLRVGRERELALAARRADRVGDAREVAARRVGEVHAAAGSARRDHPEAVEQALEPRAVTGHLGGRQLVEPAARSSARARPVPVPPTRSPRSGRHRPAAGARSRRPGGSASRPPPGPAASSVAGANETWTVRARSPPRRGSAAAPGRSGPVHRTRCRAPPLPHRTPAAPRSIPRSRAPWSRSPSAPPTPGRASGRGGRTP